MDAPDLKVARDLKKHLAGYLRDCMVAKYTCDRVLISTPTATTIQMQVSTPSGPFFLEVKVSERFS